MFLEEFGKARLLQVFQVTDVPIFQTKIYEECMLAVTPCAFELRSLRTGLLRKWVENQKPA